jgi:hypothetical protein
MMAAPLKIGDTVLWRGRWGREAAKPAVVVSIDAVEPGEKHGASVDFMNWALVPTRAVVDLNNGHWAYGEQIEPVGEPEGGTP